MMRIGGESSIVRGGLNAITDIISPGSTVVTAMTCTASSRLNAANSKDSLATSMQEQEMLARVRIGGDLSMRKVGRNALEAKQFRVSIATTVTVSIALKR